MTMAIRKTTQLIRLKFGRLRFEIYGVHGHRELIPCCGFGYYPSNVNRLKISEWRALKDVFQSRGWLYFPIRDRIVLKNDYFLFK